MNSNPVLTPQRVEAVRHLLLALAALAGFAASGYVLSSQVAADFLREGPVRITGLEGETLRVVLGLGALAATVIAVGAVWQRVHAVRLLIAAVALGGGLFLAHALLIPAVTLVTVAVFADFSGHVPRARLEKVRRSPPAWVAGALVAGAAVAGLVWVSIWLLGPLVDEGESLNETLDFQVSGLVQPDVVEPAAATEEADAMTAMPASPDTTASDEVAMASDSMPADMGAVGDEASAAGDPTSADTGLPNDAPATASEPAPADTDTVAEGDAAPAATPPARTGALIARGELMGTDAFHTGSGEVLLVSDPDGNLVLRFQDYEVRNGPDLFVFLTPDTAGDVHAEGAVSLGGIRATNGSVNYEVPADVDPTTFRAAVIYCQAFSVTFAVASFN